MLKTNLMYSMLSEQEIDRPISLLPNPDVYNSKIMEFIHKACQTLEYLNLKLESQGKKLVEVVSIKQAPFSFTATTSEIEDSLVREVVITFKFYDEADQELTATVPLTLNIPFANQQGMLKLNGVVYAPVYQLLDKAMFKIKEDRILLKNLLMPLEMKKIIVKQTAAKLDPYYPIRMNFLSSKFNPFIFSPIEFPAYCEFFGVNLLTDLSYSDNYATVQNKEDYHAYAITKKRVMLLKKSPLANRNILDTLADFILTYKLYKRDMFEVGLMEELKQASFKKRYRSTLVSLQRTLDPITYNSLNNIHPDDKQTVNHLLRYIIYFFDHLLLNDPVDLKYKRIRLEEYSILPLINKFSEISYRLLNTNQPIKLEKLKTIFSAIPKNFIQSKMISEGIVRAVDCSSGLSVFNFIRFTHGMSSMLSKKYRNQHESFLGNIALMEASASDPGASGNFVPYMEDLVDSYFFSTEIDYQIPESFPKTLN
jgi:hypothetical protein